ncbi:MAG: hypothetical protein QOE14_1888, partial [Humisphaera sp.]|nr:hypothetical protein [Humisphaera sp.]
MRNSGSNRDNEKLIERTKDYQGKGNLAFFADAVGELGTQGDGTMLIGLVGSRDFPGVALRQAQSMLRWDMSPSLWSHAFLIAGPPEKKGDVGSTPILEVTLHDRAGHFPEPEKNGVNKGYLRHYASPVVDANVALISVSMKASELKLVAERANDANFERVRHDFFRLIGTWQCYLWSFGAGANPLVEGFPMAAARYVEMAFEAIGVDITPGASERNSAPEHLWNTARWWDKNFKKMYKKELSGLYVLRDKGCALLNWEDRQKLHEVQ